MSKKHYIALSSALNMTRPPNTEATHPILTQWYADVFAVADACQQFNRAFDRARFVNACENGGAK